MATLNRRPFSTRPVPLHVTAQSPAIKPSKLAGATIKRARSPEPAHDPTLAQQVSKRARCGSTMAPPTAGRENKERRQAEREQQRNEFKEKYCRAFPSWTFCFDQEHVDLSTGALQDFETRIHHLGGAVEDFFSNEVTHLITNQPVPAGEVVSDKENNTKSRPASSRMLPHLKSPIKLKTRPAEDSGAAGYDLTAKALSFGIKIWTTAKLDSVLSRCLDVSITSSMATRSSQQGTSRALSRLLQSERIHGTSERDPSQKRHDFRYFARGSYFLLVEDLKQELATIAAHEYVLPKSRDGNPPKAPWPVLHCHPNSRGPFIPFDEKEKKRWEKTQLAEREESRKVDKTARLLRVEALRRKAEASAEAKKAGDLRRSVSMSNLRKSTAGRAVDLEDETLESNAPSGYLASAGAGYLAASGNSVGITSTTGTTSTAGYVSRSLQLPSTLSGRLKHEVVTSHKTVARDRTAPSKHGNMGPPMAIPEKQPLLKKSRSTNTMRLPKREEGTKPGYCESCRTKFDEFKAHVLSKRHRKFAYDDQNFAQLDCVLARVQRRTIGEVRDEERRRRGHRMRHCSGAREELQGIALATYATSSPTVISIDIQPSEM